MDNAALAASLTSLLAIGLTIVLVRLVRLERQRSEARVAALVSLAAEPAAAPTAVEPPVRLERRAAPPAPARRAPSASRPARFSAADVEIFREAQAPVPAPSFAGLFEPAVPRRRNPLVFVGLGAIVMVALLAAGLRWSVSSSSSGQTPTTETVASLAPAAAPVAQPLALVALRHEQGADGSLVISGVVRNPPDSIARERLFAAASLVDGGGTLVASARTPLDFTTLAPGDESPFVVRIAGASGVARYRIGFRDAEGVAVAHLDRR